MVGANKTSVKSGLNALFALLLVQVVGIARPSQAQEPGVSPPPEMRSLISDELFVYGPTVHDFDVGAFFKGHASHISAYSEFIDSLGYELSLPEFTEYVAHRYSLNPQLLLSLLELKTGILGLDRLPPETIRYEWGLVEPGKDGLTAQMESAANQLTIYFYSYPAEPKVVFTDGTTALLSTDLNAGTFALQKFLARGVTKEQWLSMIGNGEHSFSQVYKSFFGDPLVEAGGRAIALQPTLKLPLECAQTWYYTQGPHSNNLSAVDYAPGVSDCTISTKKVVSAGGGKVVVASDALVEIDHDGDGNPGTGWVTYYHHVRDIQVGVGQSVYTGSHLGYPSCEGGTATGTHLHFAFLYNGSFVGADGKILSGWTIHSTDTTGDGTICNYYPDGSFCEGTMTKPGELTRIATSAWTSNNSIVTDNCPVGNCCCTSRSAAATSSEATTFGFSAEIIEVPDEPEPLPEATSTTTAAGTLTAPITGSLGLATMPDSQAQVEPQRIPPASASYRIPKSVFGSSGGLKASTHYVMNGTQGQATDLARRQSGSYTLVPGYWGTWLGPARGYVIYLPVVIKDAPAP
jgi:LasA protease